MAYDEGLAERIREHFQQRTDVEEKGMFGGLCFMVSNHMCCGITRDTLMARVGPANYEKCLAKKQASVMDFTGKTMKGLIYVAPEGIEDDPELSEWLDICLSFIESLPPKKARL